MQMMRCMGAVVLLSAITAATLPAQGDHDHVLRVAAEAIREQLPEGAVGVDSRLPTSGRNAAARLTHHASTLVLITEVLGGRVAKKEDVVECGDTPRTCRLREGVAFVTFGAPRVRGDTAVVNVYTTFVTGLPRIPLADKDVRVVLARKGATWRVVTTTILRQT
jgi:hypothetical protein